MFSLSLSLPWFLSLSNLAQVFSSLMFGIVLRLVLWTLEISSSKGVRTLQNLHVEAAPLTHLGSSVKIPVEQWLHFEFIHSGIM